MVVKRNALGRGLDSLISMDNIQTGGSSAINEVDIAQISPNPEQPRSDFDDESLAELAMSIKELGIIQPLTLRKTAPNAYQIISGERRYRAAKLAGLQSVPAYIRTANDTEVTEMALIENIQREDLNAIEIALTFKKLLEQYNLTQERLSERIGKKRATIANFLRLLRLPAQVQMGLRNKKVDMGHARAILGVEQTTLQLKLYNETIKRNLSVRQVEALAKQYQRQIETDEPNHMPSDKPSADFELLRKHLSEVFSTKVQISCNANGKGKLTFQFKDEQQLTALIELFDKLK